MQGIDTTDGGLLSRVFTRLEKEKPLDAETVAKAREVMSAREAIDLDVRSTLDEDLPDGARRRRKTTRTVSRLGTDKPVEIELEQRWPYAGLPPMTRVRTSFGDVYAVALRKGDLIKTRSGEFKPILWLDRIFLDDDILQQMADANPILIPEGAIARGLPKKEVLLSPRQAVAAQSDFHEAQEAGDLLGRPNIRRKRETGLSYTLFHLGQTEDVLCEGLYLTIEGPD